MSDNYRHFIPTSPEYVPGPGACENVRVLLEAMCTNATEITADVSDDVEFVDAGSNFERIACPKCGAEIDNDWWGEAMDTAYATRFSDLSSTVPCCGALVSLNDLDYEWPQGFAKFVATVLNGDCEDLTDAWLAKLEEAAGCRLRVILAHY